MDIWDEVRIFLVCAGYIAPRTEEESETEYEHRVYETVDEYINRHNVEFNYDLCPTNN